MSSPDVIFQYPKYKKTVKNPLEVFWNLFPIKMKDVLVVDLPTGTKWKVP